ncbi:MAG: aldehyde dehydrogenase [Thiogranum sp.]|nr:aldehyde dehydrogenase [Thiogranum sp.]
MNKAFTHDDWRQRAAGLSFHNQAFIDGAFADAASGKTFECVNPASGQVLTRVAECGSEDVDRAVKAARKAFESGAWRDLPPRERKRIMMRFADLIDEHVEEIALLETLDVGKPIGDSISIDAPGAARCIRWYGEAIDKIYDEIAPTGVDTLGMITREPVGVVACIVPWNFPLLMAAWKIGPALVSGNSVILKPSEKSPLTALRVAALAAEAGIPDGVFNVLPGFGADAGKALARHPDVDCLAFTGSTVTGKQIMKDAADSNLKKVWMELGGKTPNIIFADCPDLDAAARAAAFAIFFNQGEMCTAGSRLLVEESIKEELLERVIKAGESMFPGDPLDPSTRMGAIVDTLQLDRVMGYIEAGKQEGARLRLGGERVLGETGGYFVAPTIFDQVSNRMTIAQEEIFGPVLSTISFRTLEEALEIANASLYGLAAAAWTGNLNKAHKVARGLRAGTVWINCFDEGDMTVPFGGYKQSGNGRDKSLHAIDKYMEVKTTWINLAL